MSKRNGKQIHAGRLVPSHGGPNGIITGAEIVEEKFLLLCNMYGNIRHERLVPPPSLDKDMLLWRRMRVRHKKGDLRHTEAELQATKAVAEWTVNVHMELRGLPPRKIDWEAE